MHPGVFNAMMSSRLFPVVALAVLLAACAAPSEQEQEDSDLSQLAIGEGEGTQGPGTEVPADADAVETESSLEVEAQRAAVLAPAKSVLNITWQGQPNGYWCGPGATRIALSSRMANPPSQQTLATYMGTTTNGTNHIGLPAAALNKWLGPATKYGSHNISEPPSAAQRTRLKADILARIGNGWPIVANIISGWRPPGYPSGTIYHYVTVVGYDAGGEKVLIADPAGEGAAGPAWRNVKRTYWISLKDLGTWIGGKGYTG
jgi:hypothetical protein